MHIFVLHVMSCLAWNVDLHMSVCLYTCVHVSVCVCEHLSVCLCRPVSSSVSSLPSPSTDMTQKPSASVSRLVNAWAYTVWACTYRLIKVVLVLLSKLLCEWFLWWYGTGSWVILVWICDWMISWTTVPPKAAADAVLTTICLSICERDNSWEKFTSEFSARYDLFCVKSAVKPQPTNEWIFINLRKR